MSQFGRYLRQVRLSRGVSQSDLAKALGIHNAYLSRVENGDNRTPLAGTVIKMAEILEQDVDLFLCVAGRIDPLIVRFLHTHPGVCRQLREHALRWEGNREEKVGECRICGEEKELVYSEWLEYEICHDCQSQFEPEKMKERIDAKAPKVE